MNTDWSGVFPAVTTKFRPDGPLDLAAMERHFRFQLEAGVHGLIVLGSLGENAVLDDSEKLEILDLAVSVAAGTVPVLACVAENTTRRARRFAQEAARHGADGLMVLPAMGYVADRREVLTHFFAVADAGNLPIMVYNNPISYRMDIDISMLAEMAREPKFVAVKESSDDIRRVTDLRNHLGDRYRIFSGVDDLALESLLLGADGWVAGLVNAFPRETVVLYEWAKEGKLKEALNLYRWFTPLLHLDVSTKLVQNIKLAEALVGIGGEEVRPPRLPLTGAERTRVTAVIKTALEQRPTLPN